MGPFPASLRIGELEVRPATALAPMAGLTDSIFRRFMRSLGGCGLVITELVSAEGLVRTRAARRPARTLAYVTFAPEERPIGAQLFGADPGVMAEAARMCQELGFDLVDVNLGCPAPKVCKGRGGSALLRDLTQVERILRAMRAAVSIPLTVKYRSGWSQREVVAVEVARLAADCGLEAVTLHPRTREQGFAGKADWSLIGAVKTAVRIPVIGNGDVTTPEDALRMVAETGCDAVMVGRAAATNPLIFRQISELLAGGSCRQLTERDRYQLLRGYYRLRIEGAHPETIGRMKQFASYFTRGVRDGARLRREICLARQPREILELVDAFFHCELDPVSG
jgi:nifR3 family TIM-barrel protein